MNPVMRPPVYRGVALRNGAVRPSVCPYICPSAPFRPIPVSLERKRKLIETSDLEKIFKHFLQICSVCVCEEKNSQRLWVDLQTCVVTAGVVEIGTTGESDQIHTFSRARNEHPKFRAEMSKVDVTRAHCILDSVTHYYY